MNNAKYLTITAITKYLKYRFDSDENLRLVYLKGEISNFKSHSTGHYYFSLKDETSKINAIMFSTNAKKLPFTPTEGMKVLVSGRISVYESTGNYQIYVDEMIEDGVGNLYIAFEQLKEKLSKEGLFDSKYKKAIPSIPRKIGIVTAPTGAAIRDILSTIKRRFPICETYLFPCLVQGENAASDIVKKIEQANTFDLDVLIVGRGGGSIEDLWSFNEEIVARAIFASHIPIISGVGHEIDWTISDYVADLRAPTPTGAAELVVPNIADLLKHIKQMGIRANEAIFNKINISKLYLDSLKSSYVIKNPMIMYDNKKQKLDNMYEKIKKIMSLKLERMNNRLNNIKRSYILTNPQNMYINNQKELYQLVEKLELLNPLGVLKRGYTLAYHDNKIVKGITNLKVNDLLDIRFNDGIVNVRVNEIKEVK